jgi:flagellar hook-associated protein 3 FlgL
MLSATRYRAAAEIGRQNRLAVEISKLQQSISSEKRLTKASDDPTASTRISEIRQTQADQLVWQRNITTGAGVAGAADDRLSGIADLLNRAKELMLSGRNDSTSQTDRQVIAQSLRALAADLDTAQAALDPAGDPLFPEGDPILIPVSETLALPATLSRARVFGGVETADGTKTLQQILGDAADAIVRADDDARGTEVTAAIASLDAGINHAIGVRTDLGVQAGRFDSANETLDAQIQQQKEERSIVEDTDLTYALSQFQAKQLSLQASQTVFAQSMRSNLFDLLR